MTDEPEPRGSLHHLSGDLPLETVEKEGYRCSHYQTGFRIDEDTRTATCKRCGEHVDAFLALESLAKQWGWAKSRVKMADQQASSASEQLKDIKRDITNAKSRLARVNKKLPEIELERAAAVQVVGALLTLVQSGRCQAPEKLADPRFEGLNEVIWGYRRDDVVQQALLIADVAKRRERSEDEN